MSVIGGAVNTACSHHRLSCLPLMCCPLNLNYMWVCVGSVTHNKHGRGPGIDAFSRHGAVDDSPSCSVSVNVCVLAYECKNPLRITLYKHYTIHGLYNYEL